MKIIELFEGKTDERPFGLNITKAIKTLKTILADKKNYTVGSSGDAYAIKAAEINKADENVIIAIYTNDNPVKDFYFRWNNKWFNTKGNVLTSNMAIEDMRRLDPDKYGWAEIILKPKALKILNGD